MKTRTAKEIEHEIVELKKALALPDRYNAATRKILGAQIRVLTEQMTVKQVENDYYEDETDPDYQDGDNELWADADATARWLAGDDSYDPPSQGV
jgi:hypothetical protein